MEKIFKALQKQQIEANELQEYFAELEEQGKLRVNTESKKGRKNITMMI